MQAFVPKNRRPRFELLLRILDLNNVPLSSGTAYVKWHLPPSTTAEQRGVTDKAIIIDHRAYWSYEKIAPVRLTIDRNQTLQERDIVYEVIQEFGSGGREDKCLLGRVKLNLAEYVDKSEDEEVIVRRYLLRDSKINSTLKVAMVMRQIEGDRNYNTPPLKLPMVFGGITGVVASEQGDSADDLGQDPSRNSKSREAADMQDMYRRTLVASFNSPASDLPADKLIEDLFAGGSGWNERTITPHHRQHSRIPEENDDGAPSPYSDSDSKQIISGNRLSPGLGKRPRSSSSNPSHSLGKAVDIASSAGHSRKTGSIEQKLLDGAKGKHEKSSSGRLHHEVSEFDVREDLRSWEVSTKE